MPMPEEMREKHFQDIHGRVTNAGKQLVALIISVPSLFFLW